MPRTDGRHGHEPDTQEPDTADRRRPSVMSILALLNDSDGDSRKLPRANVPETQQLASYADDLPIRSRTHPPSDGSTTYSTPPLARRRAGSSSTQSSEGTAPSARRANRPKYSDEEIAFIWFHRVDLRQEWDAIVRAFNRHFRHSHLRDKSGLECKLYRVLGAQGVPQIREWRKRGHRGVKEAITYYGIIECTSIRYPWMGPRYWPPRQ